MRHFIRYSALLILLAGVAYGQKINPINGIDWSRAGGCAFVGYAYSPAANQCVPAAGTVGGPWNAQTAYPAGSVVQYGGVTYLAIAGSVNVNPSISPASWTPTSTLAGGTWSSTVSYAAGAVVQYGGTTYLALAPSTNVAPGSSSTTWTVVSGGSGTLTNQTPGFLPLATSATASTASSGLQDTGSGLSYTPSTSTSAHYLSLPASTVPFTPAAGVAAYSTDSAGNAVVSENGVTAARICTTANGVCPGANLASPPPIGNVAPNTVNATLAQATSVGVTGSRANCNLFASPTSRGCHFVYIGNDSTWLPGNPGLIGETVAMTETGPGQADASVQARLMTGLLIANTYASPSITNDISISSNKIATGDYLPINQVTFGRMGWTEASDQGYNGYYATGGSPLGHPTYTIGTGGTAATTVVPTGAPTGCFVGSYGGDACKRIAQGSFLLDIQNAPVATTVLSPSTTFAPCPWLQQVAVTAASLPAASTWGCASGVNSPKNILPNAPQAFTFTLTSGAGLFTAGQHVTIGGSEHYEQSVITSVTGTAGAQTITLPLAYANSNISIWAGGIEGTFLSTDAVYAASGGQHRTSYPVMGNTGTGTLIYEIPQQGTMKAGGFPMGTGDPTTTDGTANAAIHLYCGAKVSVVNDFNNPNTYALEPNKCTWVPGNKMEQPDHPSQFAAAGLVEVKMNAPGTLEGWDVAIGGFGAAGNAFAFSAGNENTPCFQSGGGCVGTTMRAPLAAYGIGLVGNTGLFDNHLYSTLAPLNSIININAFNAGQTGVKIATLPGGYMRYNGSATVVSGRDIPYQWRFDSDGAQSVRASFYQFNKDGAFALGVSSNPSGNIALGTSFVPSSGFVNPSGTLEVGNLIPTSLTAGPSPLCANGTGGALTNVGCNGSAGGTGGVLSGVPTGAVNGTNTLYTISNLPRLLWLTRNGVFQQPGLQYVAPTAIPAPSGVTPTPSATGGTLAAGTYYYSITATNGYGETLASTAVSTTTTGTTGSVSILWGAVTGATGYKVYRGTSPAGPFVYYTTSTPSYTDTNAASTAGSIPTASTAGAYFNFNTGHIPQTGDALYAQAIY